ncbi:MAG: glucose-inhibited division protein B [Natronospirillum sp.]|uniref:hypothetical protein n=1 Tax=Natronospirillum sp. TaxID=2812955 RepID=UPI0025F546C9|nr:hypothetical protein [Natronospirillum sp.]MCH8553266.1 glucose-inhibited division protein B [Natronospirillum sp.]
MTKLLPCALLLSTLVLTACTDVVLERSLEQLVAHQSGYAGRDVRTTGVVRSFDDPLHFWIEDDELNRVAIEPEDRVADHVGQRVQVTGTFISSADSGRIIRAEQVERLPE